MMIRDSVLLFWATLYSYTGLELTNNYHH